MKKTYMITVIKRFNTINQPIDHSVTFYIDAHGPIEANDCGCDMARKLYKERTNANVSVYVNEVFSKPSWIRRMFGARR